MELLQEKTSKWKIPVIAVSIIALLILAFASYKFYENYKEKEAIRIANEQNKKIAEEALKSLKKIDAAIQVGVSQSEYSRMLIEAQTSANQVFEKLPYGNLRQEIKLAMENYIDAMLLWEESGTRQVLFACSVNDVEQTSWAAKAIVASRNSMCNNVIEKLASKYKIQTTEYTFHKLPAFSREDGLTTIWLQAREHIKKSTLEMNKL